MLNPYPDNQCALRMGMMVASNLPINIRPMNNDLYSWSSLFLIGSSNYKCVSKYWADKIQVSRFQVGITWAPENSTESAQRGDYANYSCSMRFPRGNPSFRQPQGMFYGNSTNYLARTEPAFMQIYDSKFSEAWEVHHYCANTMHLRTTGILLA